MKAWHWIDSLVLHKLVKTDVSKEKSKQCWSQKIKPYAK